MTTPARHVHDAYLVVIGELWHGMNASVELRRRTWVAALRLALIVSVVGAVIAIVASLAGDVAQAAIVIPVIVVGFAASWVQTGRVQRRDTFFH